MPKKITIDTYNPWTSIIILVTVVLIIYSAVLNFYSIDSYKKNKVINVVSSNIKKKCTYTPDMLPFLQTLCFIKDDIDYMLYPGNGSVNGLYYGLKRELKSNVCNQLCEPDDYYTITQAGRGYESGKEYSVKSTVNKESSGMRVTVKVNKEKNNSVETITFINNGSEYNLDDTLEIMQPNPKVNNIACKFILVSLPGKGCDSNENYNLCIQFTRPNNDCSNQKPIVSIKDGSDTINLYPNIVFTKLSDDIPIESCKDLSKI